MNDPRIKVYREAALAMADGAYRQELPLGPADEVGQLGEALASLGRTLEQRSTELLTLAKVAERINGGLLLDEVMDKAYRVLRTLVPFDRMSLGLLDRDAQVLTVRWVRTEAERTFLDAGHWQPVAGSGLPELLEAREPRIRNDLPGHLAAQPRCEAVRLLVAEGMQADLECPLAARGRAVGVLGFASMVPGIYRRGHQELLAQLSGQLALILEKSALHQDLQELAELRGRLLAGAAGSLGAPLEAVLGLLEQLAGGPGLEPAQRELVQRALAGQSELRQRLGAFQEAAALGAGVVPEGARATDLRQLLEGVIRTHREAAAARGVQVAGDYPPGDAIAQAAPQQLARLLEILVGQLLARSAPGGRIALAWRRLEAFDQVRVSAPGLGLAKDQLAGLFTVAGLDRRPGADAAGVGLALARRVLEAHGGRLQADSSLEAGTTFTVWLPKG